MNSIFTLLDESLGAKVKAENLPMVMSEKVMGDGAGFDEG